MSIGHSSVACTVSGCGAIACRLAEMFSRNNVTSESSSAVQSSRPTCDKTFSTKSGWDSIIDRSPMKTFPPTEATTGRREIVGFSDLSPPMGCTKREDGAGDVPSLDPGRNTEAPACQGDVRGRLPRCIVSCVDEAGAELAVHVRLAK